MSKTKKILMLIFTVALVINLQLTGTLTSGMENGFSLEQLADNIFVPSALAVENWAFGPGICLSTAEPCCGFQFMPSIGCDPSDPDWHCDLADCW